MARALETMEGFFKGQVGIVNSYLLREFLWWKRSPIYYIRIKGLYYDKGFEEGCLEALKKKEDRG